MMLREIEPLQSRERLQFFEDMMAATSAQISLQQVRKYQDILRGAKSRPASTADLNTMGIQVCLKN